MEMVSASHKRTSFSACGWWCKVLPEKAVSKVAEIARQTKKVAQDDPRRLIHSIKVGLALTLVSLLYHFQPLHRSFSVSGMWAVMTVVVVFEYSVGATVGKGLNRGLATVSAAALGLGAHYLASMTGGKPLNIEAMNVAVNGEASELLQAHAQIWNHIFNFINSMSLKCAIQLGIPDIIHNHGKPMTLSELIDALKINNAKAPCVYRLMRILTHSGFFVKAKIAGNDKEEAYILTPASKLLLKDEPLRVSPFLFAMLDPILTTPWHQLSDWFQNNDLNPFATTHGKRFWDLAGQEPRLNHFFNEAMASDARLISRLVIGNHKEVFQGLNSLVDVGGGTGTMAKAIADAFPQLKCTVLDLPHVVQGLEGTKNLAYVGGDMFESIPPTDAVLLKWILHDCSDEESLEILKKCKEAIPSKERGGKVIIIDMVLGDQNEDNAATETQLFFDMLMMVLVTGRERNEKDWAKLFVRAGFTDYKIAPMLGLRSLIEVYY